MSFTGMLYKLCKSFEVMSFCRCVHSTGTTKKIIYFIIWFKTGHKQSNLTDKPVEVFINMAQYVYVTFFQVKPEQCCCVLANLRMTMAAIFSDNIAF